MLPLMYFASNNSILFSTLHNVKSMVVFSDTQTYHTGTLVQRVGVEQ